jgi:hypothetical protein
MTVPVLEDKPLVGAGGGVYAAPALTDIPTDFDAIKTTPWLYLGLISEDGVSYTPLEEETEDIKVWQLAFPWDVVTTGQASSIAFALAQWNQKSVEFMFSGGTWDDAGLEVSTFTPPGLGETIDTSVFLHVVTSVGGNMGVYYRRAKVTKREDSTFNKGEMSTLGMTVTMLGVEGEAPQILMFDKGGVVVAP